MDHTFYTDRLSAYFDQELKHEEHAIVDQHVKECAECQKILANLEKFDNFIEDNSDFADIDYWEKSAQKIEAAITGESKTKIIDVKKESTYKGLWWKLAGVAASIAVIAFITLYETDITEQLDNKNNVPTPSVESGEESVDKKPASVEKQLQQESNASVSEGLRSKDITVPEVSEPKVIPDKYKSNREKPADSPVKKEKITEELRTEDTDLSTEAISIGRADTDAKVLSEPEEIPQKTQSPSLAKQKIKIAEKPATADEAIETYEMEMKEVKDEASSITSGVTETDDQTENLAVWQNTIVTQNHIISNFDSNKSYKKLTNGLAASGSAKDTTDKKAVYNELFEAYYNVALLSKDSTERQNALLQLNNYANDSKFIYQNTAKLYLNQFDSVQNLNTVIKRNKRK